MRTMVYFEFAYKGEIVTQHGMFNTETREIQLSDGYYGSPEYRITVDSPQKSTNTNMKFSDGTHD